MAQRRATSKGFARTSSLLTQRIRKASESRGFAQSRLLTHWEEVVGEDIAAIARPVNVSYGRQGFGASLTLLTTGTNAPILEMQKEQIRAKVNAVYGGRPMSKDKIELKHNPAILVGTPGRILDHFDNDRFSKAHIKTLILDEFDKSLEVGFEYEMRGIINQLPNINKRILTSATQETQIPDFVKLKNPKVLNYLTGKKSKKLDIKVVTSSEKNKTKTLFDLLHFIGNELYIANYNSNEIVKVNVGQSLPILGTLNVESVASPYGLVFDGNDMYVSDFDTKVVTFNIFPVTTNSLQIAQNWSIFPNPTQEFIQIQDLNLSQTYTIVDMAGRVLQTGVVYPSQKVSIQNLMKGMYFIRLENGEVEKFMKY